MYVDKNRSGGGDGGDGDGADQRGRSSITVAAKTTPCNLSLGDKAHPWARAASLSRCKQITFYIRDPKKRWKKKPRDRLYSLWKYI